MRRLNSHPLWVEEITLQAEWLSDQDCRTRRTGADSTTLGFLRAPDRLRHSLVGARAVHLRAKEDCDEMQGLVHVRL